MPTITSMFAIAQRMLKAKYYGYLNSDILVEPRLFDVLSFCEQNVKQGTLSAQVSESLLFNDSMKLHLVYMNVKLAHFQNIFLALSLYNSFFISDQEKARFGIREVLLAIPIRFES